MEQNILKVLVNNPTATYTFISDNLGISETSVYNAIRKLKEKGWIKREKGRKHGNWITLLNN